MTDDARDPIVAEAQKRFQRTLKFENRARTLFQSDYRFANGDSDNNYQWEDDERNSRAFDKRPCLTVNKVRQHNLNIINEAKQNKPAIKYMPTGNGATFEAAQVWTALARRIEYRSNASDVYSTATEFMVQAGWGFARLITEYEDERSFAQRLRIVRIPDPLKVAIDPDAQERDKSDMNFAFIFEDHDKDEWIKAHPDWKGGPLSLALDAGDWITDNRIRTAEYFRVVEVEDTLYEFMSDEGPILRFGSELPPEVLKEWKMEPLRLRKRPQKRRKVEWYYIVGNEVQESDIWPGRYIPVVPFIAEETVIHGELDRKSHTRALKDPQRIYNWYTSANVEFGALQTKTPWIAPADAIDGIESDWAQANRANKAVLTYNGFTEDGQAIPPPQRIQPPISAPVALEGMEVASREMAMASGQYDSQMGAPSNERSGKAINERQRMGDRATYHYIDAVAVAIRLVGKIILNVIPYITDAEQLIQVMDETGANMEVKLDPGMQQAFMAQMNENNEIVQRVLNPAVGIYDVMADVGPGYATRREETFNALVLLLTQAPQLAMVIGDLLFRSGDFMYADEAAMRLRRMVPPQALGQGPSQQEQELMAQLQQMQQLLSQLSDDYAAEKLKNKAKHEKRDVDIYNAFTQRLKVLQDAGMSEQQHALAVAQLVRDMMTDSLDASKEAVDTALGAGEERGEKPLLQQGPRQMELPLGSPTPPVPGAERAPDGNWYVKHPMGQGWMRVHEG